MTIKFCNKTEDPILSCHKHSHSDWEIILQLSGSVSSTIGNSTYNITKGDVMVIPPMTLHDGISDTPYRDIYIQAENLDFSDVLIVHDYDDSIFLLMNILHKVTTEKENNYLTIADNLLETICQYIKKYSIKNYKYGFVNELKNMIYSNISNADFNISEAIRKMGFNIDYFRRCFQEELNKTPLEYLTHLRLNQAKKLLTQETFISVRDVSSKCGFYDSFYFSKTFKKHIGLSPREYRKNSIENL